MFLTVERFSGEVKETDMSSRSHAASEFFLSRCSIPASPGSNTLSGLPPLEVGRFVPRNLRLRL